MRFSLFAVGLLVCSTAMGCSGGGADHAAEALDGGDAAADTDDGAVLEAGQDRSPDAQSSDCPILQTDDVPATAAHSSGFSGSDMSYFGLFGASCGASGDCVAACVAAGGSMDSCTAGSECLPRESASGDPGCVPPSYWLGAAGALSESGMTTNAAQDILVDIPYDDSLMLTNFAVSIPDSATITGIQFRIRRATLTSNAVDDTVRVLKDGAPVGSNHAQAAAWPGDLAYASYGGAYDVWGAEWTVADLRSPNFGIAIAPKYTGPSAGNERAYIDSARVTVFYTTPCN